MKIMIVGDWHSKIHEEAICNAIDSLGHATVRFPWNQYFFVDVQTRYAKVARLIPKLQNKAIAGPLVRRINADLIERALSERPDAIFIYRGTHVFAKSLRTIKAKQPNIVLVGYNNDDPFSEDGSRMLWRHFISSIPFYDIMLAYRIGNIEDFRKAGAKRVELLRSWFVEEKHRPLLLSEEDRAQYECDVVFAGHYEPDNRVEMLEAIAKEGFKLRIFGPEREWNAAIQKSPYLCHLYPVKSVWEETYSKAITGGKVALCFLSKLNRDTYTRRVFEITGLRRLLLSEFTDDLATIFEEDREAVFFRSKEELLRKVKQYVSDDKGREEIAQRGYNRVHRDGHDVRSRMCKVIEWISDIQQQTCSAN